MPRASVEYCKRTPVHKMGFSQRSSCKAQGIIKRSSGKKFKSPSTIQRRGSKRVTKSKRTKNRGSRSRRY